MRHCILPRHMPALQILELAAARLQLGYRAVASTFMYRAGTTRSPCHTWPQPRGTPCKSGRSKHTEARVLQSPRALVPCDRRTGDEAKREASTHGARRPQQPEPTKGRGQGVKQPIRSRMTKAKAHERGKSSSSGGGRGSSSINMQR